MKTLNIKLLRKIQKHILEKPRRFLMSTFYVRAKDIDRDFFVCDGSSGEHVKFEECGTAACIGGWAVFLSATKGVNAQPQDIRGRAIKLLGLKTLMGDELFEVDYWPAKFKDAYDSAKSQQQRARIAARRIDHFIATKGAE